MKMDINHLFDHDEGHCTSFVKITRPNKEENWNGFYEDSRLIKEAKRRHMSVDKLERLYEEHAIAEENSDSYIPFEKYVTLSSRQRRYLDIPPRLIRDDEE